MSLRIEPVERPVLLPDGRTGVVWVGVPDDSYVGRGTGTVALELSLDGAPVAALTTLLDPDDVRVGRELAARIAAGLESGQLEPTAAALEPLANDPR